MRTIGVMILLLASAAMAQAPTFQPVGTTLQVMRSMVIPSSDVIFNIPSQAPNDDKEWAAVQNSALILAESGNLLMMAGRIKDNREWMKDSKALVDAGAAAFKAANAKDVNKLGDVGDDILTACETCHKKYKPDSQ
jgi:cytochrome c553